MIMSKTSELYRKQHAQWSANYDALIKCALEEFPVGTKVTFPHGLKTLRGTIKDHSYHSTSFSVVTKTGGQFRVECQHLTRDTEAEKPAAFAKGGSKS
jgi:hypothetical protein